VKSTLGGAVISNLLFLVGTFACSGSHTSTNSDPKTTANTVQQGSPNNTGGAALPPVDESRFPLELRNIPNAQNNPIRSGAIQIIGFNEDPEAVRWFLAKVFDMAANLDSNVFQQVISKMKSLENRKDDEYCTQTGAVAYAQIGGTGVNICKFLDMSQEPTKAFVDATENIFHEGLHLTGLNHDREDLTYAPCEGTSKSGEILYKIKICRDSYCEPFKKELPLYMRSVLDYNFYYYNDSDDYIDDRTNTGQCWEWKQEFNFHGPKDQPPS
jgi:hypothetical protein